MTWWPSPAKLNLFLHITGRRDDGYHTLQSLFQLLNYGDQLAFEITDDGTITLQNPIDGVASEDNLIWRAARLLQQHCDCRHGANIYLKKVLPMGGGIGGGSSNAATVLVALNTLWNCGLDDDMLAALGLQLGADVPIFVRGHTAFAEGVGEIITPVELPRNYYLVVYPGVSIATADIFGDPDLCRSTAKIRTQDYRFETTRNDCQPIALKRHPKVAKILRGLLEYAPSRMTGTGACLFGVFENENDANHALKALPEGCTGFVASGVNRSPLLNTRDNVTGA